MLLIPAVAGWHQAVGEAVPLAAYPVSPEQSELKLTNVRQGRVFLNQPHNSV